MRRILLAEDDATLRKAIASALQNAGYEVVATDNGADAETRARTEVFDLVILDVMMPHKSGFDLCFELRMVPELRRMPIIVMTSFTAESDKDDKYWRELSRADDFITKPFQLNVLLDKVAGLLEARQQAVV
jgi:DNA-binding response OmpR family regulator